SLSGDRRWPPRVRTKGSLPSLAQRETVFGDTWSRAAACDAVRCLGSLGLGWRLLPPHTVTVRAGSSTSLMVSRAGDGEAPAHPASSVPGMLGWSLLDLD